MAQNKKMTIKRTALMWFAAIILIARLLAPAGRQLEVEMSVLILLVWIAIILITDIHARAYPEED